MNLYRIYPSIYAEYFVCTTLTDDPDHGPAEALEMTRKTCMAPELTETAYAELVREE